MKKLVLLAVVAAGFVSCTNKEIKDSRSAASVEDRAAIQNLLDQVKFTKAKDPKFCSMGQQEDKRVFKMNLGRISIPQIPGWDKQLIISNLIRDISVINQSEFAITPSAFGDDYLDFSAIISIDKESLKSKASVEIADANRIIYRIPSASDREKNKNYLARCYLAASTLNNFLNSALVVSAHCSPYEYDSIEGTANISVTATVVPY